ncbi:MAG: DUF302 domain-containing protein [Elusimicrobia bacterium]|nr:DUF302 domain-containing protein [Elusimicrobiota bacterium]
MLHIVESSRTVAEIVEHFPKAAAAHKFGVLGQHDLRQKLKEKGIPFDRDCTVFEICSPLNAKAVLEADMAISTALPCRVAVYSEGGLTKIATLSPTMLLQVFGHPELKPAAEEVENVIYAIMDELR